MRICWFPGVLVLMVNFALVDNAINPACDCVVYQSYGLSRGNFHSPNYPQVYDRGIECILFTFIGDVDERVELTFVEFDLKWKDPGADRCGDYLHLFLNLERGEVNENSDYDIELCGNISALNQKTYYSRGRSLVLEFHSDPTKNLSFTGFKGIFKFLDALSVNLPFVKLPPGVLLIPRATGEFVSSCQKEQGTMCSYTCPSNPGHRLGNHKFFSPRFPQNYPKAICHYQFLGQDGEKVRLHFKTIQLYNRDDLPCDKADDYIEVHDGIDRDHPTIRQYCGSGGEESRVVTSKGSFMFVIFNSNNASHHKGFAASYDFISKHSTPPYTTSPDPDVIFPHSVKLTNCNKNFSSYESLTGIVNSTQFPGRYPPTTRCRYIFTGNPDERVQIRFTDMDLFYSGGNKDNPRDCSLKDSITVYDVLNNVETVIDVFCGAKHPPQLMSSGPYLKIEFNSKSHIDHVHFTGFRFLYKFRSDYGISTGKQERRGTCNFKYDSKLNKTGRFVSPNHPGLYPKATTCHYIFHGEENEKVKIMFQSFEVHGKYPSCQSEVGSDFVSFSNFYGVEDRDMPRLCGMLKPESTKIESDHDFLTVMFKSNTQQEGSGFEAHYTFFKKEVPMEASNTPQVDGNDSVRWPSNLTSIVLLYLVYVIVKHSLTTHS